MYVPIHTPDDRVFTAYFVQIVTPEHSAAFVADLRAWAADGPYRLLVVADGAVDTLSDEAHRRVERALSAPPLCDAIDRIAVTGPADIGRRAEALDAVLPLSVRHFDDDWHGAQTWLRAPIGA